MKNISRKFFVVALILLLQLALAIQPALAKGENPPASIRLTLPMGSVSAQHPAYVRSTSGTPWGTTTNEQIMDTVFGAGNWADLRFETVDPAVLFSPAYDLIFMDGSEAYADIMENFLNPNWTLIQDWVNAGGRLFLNAAPNVGDGMSYGFGGVQLSYPAFSGTGVAVAAGNPIFNGPLTPVGTNFTGGYFSHGSVSGGGVIRLMSGASGNTPLAEKSWGSGCVLFGGMTAVDFHGPQPNATNLRANILTYLSNNCVSNDPPTIDIVSVYSSGGNLFSQIALSDPEGDLLSGSVDILGGETLPTSVTFESLSTSCYTSSPQELSLNGSAVGSNTSPANCTCTPGVTTNVFSGAAVTGPYLHGSNNTWTFNQSDPEYDTYTSWVKATIQFEDGSSQNACLFDLTGSGCTTTNLCLGNNVGPLTGSSVQPTKMQVLDSQSYNNSTLPAFLDTSSLTAGNYILTANASDGINPVVEDTQPFTLTNEPRLIINQTGANRAPVLGSIGDQSVNELATLAFTATATDSDLGQTLTFSLDAGYPTGAAIDGSTGAFTWTPSEAQGPGAYPVTVRVTDNGVPVLSDYETLTITVAEVNTAPVLGSIGDQSVNELATLAFTATATDSDLGQTLTFSLDAGYPTGAAIDGSTGAFTWTPSEAQGPGAYPVTVRVTDNGVPVLSDYETLTITVAEVNTAPVLGSIGDQSVAEGNLLAFSASATDSDLPANGLTFSLDAGFPTGAAIDASTGAFTWTPSELQGPGAYPVTVRVTDNGTPVLSDFETLTITVAEVNTAPVLGSIGDQSVDEGNLLAFTASATDSDLPANGLTFSLDAGYPTGAAIDASTGAFTWTPSEAQGPGVYPVTVRVTDNGTPNLSDSETLTITVAEVNTAPVLGSIGNKSVAEGNLLAFSASATDSDLPANGLTFSLDAGFPTGAAIDGSTGAFTWTPSELQGPGAYPVTVRVTDNGTPVLSNSETLTITVAEVNTAPVLGSIGDKSVDEGNLLAFSASATDSDLPANGLTFSLDAGYPTGAAIDASTGAFTWTPSELQGPGTYPVTVRVTDNGTPNLSDFEILTITVAEVNTAPVLGSIGDQSVDEGNHLAFTASATDSDLPANGLTFSLDAGFPTGAAIDGSTGAFTWTPSEVQGPGAYPVTVRVTDNGTPVLSDSETLTITVAEVNTAPVLGSIGNKSVDEGNLLAFSASATDSDLPANGLTFSLDAGYPTGAAIDTSTGAFTWTPSEVQGPGAYPVTVRVTDNGTPVLSDSETLTITVAEVNTAPVLGSIGDKSVDEGNLLAFTASATDSDLPANTLTFSLDAGFPTGAAIDGSTGAFTWTPSEAQGPGAYPVTVRVTDNGTPVLSDSETLTITVAEVNTAPVLGSIGDKSVDELATLAFTATATDSDLPANGLTFSLDAGYPTGAAIDASTGAFTWTPSELQGPGAYPVTVRVTDNGIPVLSDSETLTITVNEVNQPPAADAGSDLTVNAGDQVQLDGSDSSDPDGQALTYSWLQTGGSPQMTLSDPAAVTPTFTASSAGVYTFTLTVADTYGATDSDEVVITVLALVNPQADLSVTMNRTGIVNVTFTIVVTNLGPDAADGAMVHDEFPAVFSNVSWTCSASNGAACNNPSGSGNVLDETIDQLPSGGSITFTVLANISLNADDGNTVTVSAPSGVSDPDPSNNQASLPRSFRYWLPFVLKNNLP